MNLENYYYLFVVATVFIPAFLLSFNKKIGFWTLNKRVFLSVLGVGVLFIIWDIYFTHLGVWGFNKNYIVGISFFGLPLEEFLFLITTSYASVLMFENIQQYFPDLDLKNAGRLLMGGFLGFSLLFLSKDLSNSYTTTTATIALASSSYFLYSDPKWLGHFALTFILILIPFLLLNSLLTGSYIAEEIIWYNQKEILGTRVGTIPLEDFFYLFILLIWNCFVFEKFKD